VFDEDLRDLLPDRVLPIATRAPLDPVALFTEEIEEVARLLRPGRRQGTEAVARLRALSIVDGAIQGERLQPSEYQLRKLGSKISAGATSTRRLPWNLGPGTAHPTRAPRSAPAPPTARSARHTTPASRLHPPTRDRALSVVPLRMIDAASHETSPAHPPDTATDRFAEQPLEPATHHRAPSAPNPR
jgi:hypothetical protein